MEDVFSVASTLKLTMSLTHANASLEPDVDDLTHYKQIRFRWMNQSMLKSKNEQEM